MGTLFACLLSDPTATLLDSAHCLGRGWGSEWGRQPLHLRSLDCLAVYFSHWEDWQVMGSQKGVKARESGPLFLQGHLQCDFGSS